MEVHHHPDPRHKTKSFREYFLEFLMIFLAVTLGFFAENLREHIGDEKKENNYIISLVKDLETDTSNASISILHLNNIMNEMNAALRISNTLLHDFNLQDTFYYHFLGFFNYEATFHQNDNTLTQLTNAGGYSFIQKKGITDSIIALVNFYKRVKVNEGFYHDDFIKLEDFASRLIKIPFIQTDANGNSVYPGIYTNTEFFNGYDKQMLEQLYSLIEIEKTQLVFFKIIVARYKTKAADLITFLKKEYHLG